MKRHLVPLCLGALAMAGSALLLFANLAVQAAGHTPIKLVPGLIGQTQAEPVVISADAVLSLRLQTAVGHRIGAAMPLYPAAVRLSNQVQYSLFGASANPVVMVGQHGALIERAYADEYCARDIASWRPGALAWAARIKAMQDAQARRGRAFLYLLTPSKVAQYPGLLPAGFTCPAAPADRTGLVPQWVAMLRAAGVHLVDTTGVLQAAHGAYPFRLFPPGGTHWNAVGAALAQQAVMTGLDRVLPGSGFVPTPFTWHMQPHPERDSDDADLARLLNLFVPAANGPVPVVTPHPPPPAAPCRKLRVAMVGGSFGHATLEALSFQPCPVQATEYEYWHSYTLHWRGGELDKHFGVDPTARDADLLAADVLIYEENEQVLGQPEHGMALSQFLRDQAAGLARNPL